MEMWVYFLDFISPGQGQAERRSSPSLALYHRASCTRADHTPYPVMSNSALSIPVRTLIRMTSDRNANPRCIRSPVNVSRVRSCPIRSSLSSAPVGVCHDKPLALQDVEGLPDDAAADTVGQSQLHVPKLLSELKLAIQNRRAYSRSHLLAKRLAFESFVADLVGAIHGLFFARQ